MLLRKVDAMNELQFEQTLIWKTVGMHLCVHFEIKKLMKLSTPPYLRHILLVSQTLLSALELNHVR